MVMFGPHREIVSKFRFEVLGRRVKDPKLFVYRKRNKGVDIPVIDEGS